MSDVARLAGVSPMTVSRALHRPEMLSSETLERIRTVISGLDYVPDMVAGSLSSTSSRTIGIVVPTLSHSIFSETIQGISDALRPLRFQTFVSATGFSMEMEELVVRAMLGRRPDSMVLTGFNHTEATRRMLADSGTTVFEMWNTSRPPIDMAVGFSNKQAASDMTRYLIDRGFRQIGYIGGPIEFNDRTQDREAGFIEAMKDAGLRVPAHAIVREPLEYSGGARALERLLQHRPRVEAIFAGAEMLAVGALSAALERGISVPKDLAIAGFDDSELGMLMKPRLTSVRLPRYEVGRLIAQNILARISGELPVPPKVVDVGYTLVIRDSA
jgi:LacI family transcriptional regulator, gluconate utilization system Gnt-I transcriptional repressor